MATDVLTDEGLYQKTPQQLTTILYEACLERLDRAVECLDRKDYLEVNQLLQKCNDILYRLGGGINYEAGLIADQLDALYNYMAERLIRANVHKDKAAVLEVRKLLGIIHEAWTTASHKGKDDQTGIAKQRARAYDQEILYPQGNVNLRE
ncbi:flagellar export chaperone FliS [Gorillibacterium timonense]|uniref:flagellar export chaperone FliS n=1 Tax=Gorillibacterium timonense TaxID=1689269 RepID=UPI00071C6C27|nr:flagellar export chaperone FliS [Gorillibacterium timonense]